MYFCHYIERDSPGVSMCSISNIVYFAYGLWEE